MHYFADARWWRWHKDEPEYQALTCERAHILTDAQPIEDLNVWLLHNLNNDSRHQVLSEQPNGIASGQSSGYQAVNIAYLAGAARIVLLGYDAKVSAERKVHWFGDHPSRTPEGWLSTQPALFAKLAPLIKARGVDVINCTPDSAIRCFRHEAIESVLPDPAAAAVPA